MSLTKEETETMFRLMAECLIQDPRIPELAALYTRDKKILARLAEHENTRVLEAVAGNPATPPEILERLAEHKGISVLFAVEGISVLVAVAGNPTTSPEILERLAEHEYTHVPETVAGNPATPPEILERLAEHKNTRVLVVVAGNPATPPEILKRLAAHWHFSVLCRVAGNRKTPETILRALVKVGSIPAMEVARNPCISRELFLELVQSKDVLVRNALSENPRLSKEDLAHMLRHWEDRKSLEVEKERDQKILKKITKRLKDLEGEKESNVANEKPQQ